MDYVVASRGFVDPATGYIVEITNTTTIGSSDTDDNVWNIGDSYSDGSPSMIYDGYFVNGLGYVYMVFVDDTSGAVKRLVSPTAKGGYPAHIDDIPTLTKDPVPLCFAKGSQIATPSGDRPVEALTVGDRVLTLGGRAVEVKWTGRQTVPIRFGPADRLRLVRIATGALGERRPYEPLTVTADHGMLVDGVICHAGALVNGTTITRVTMEEMGESCTVYHIETEAHEIILANGAPAETFIDNVSRRCFDNYAEFEALYGDVPKMQELPYPRAMSARQVPGRIHALLNGRMAA
jgi:hypothetical protein